jgi:hypothetical protein
MPVSGIFREIYSRDIETRERWPSAIEYFETLSRAQETVARQKEAVVSEKVDAMAAYPVKFSATCFRCGANGHMKNECTKNVVECSICGYDHLSKFHNIIIEKSQAKSKDSNSSTDKKSRFKEHSKESSSSVNRGSRNSKFQSSTRGSSKNYKNKKASMKRVPIANLIDLMDSDESNVDREYLANLIEQREYFEDDEVEVDEELLYQSDDETSNYCLSCEEVSVAVATSTSDDIFIIDTGAKGAHVVKSSELLSNETTSRYKISGFNGHASKAVSQGCLFGFINQFALFSKEVNANLLSMDLLLKDFDSFKGSKYCLRLMKDGETALLALKRKDGYYICSAKSVREALARCKAARLAPKLLCSMPTSEPNSEALASIADPVLFSAEQRKRAEDAYLLCAKLGHPNSESIIAALNNNIFPGTTLSGQDVRNSIALFGPCPHCIEGKMRAPSEPSSNSQPASAIGEIIHIDYIPLPEESIAKNRCLWFAVDEFSGYIYAIASPSKSKSDVIHVFNRIIAHFAAFGHRSKLQNFRSDDDVAIKAAIFHLNSLGINLATTPKDLHEKRAERMIQTIKSRARACLCTLDYILPKKLFVELFQSVIHSTNSIPSSNHPTTCPFQIFTGKKPFIPSLYFGQLVFAYSERTSAPEVRSELAIFISHGIDKSNSRYIRVFNPFRENITGVRKAIPTNTLPPANWPYPRRINYTPSTNSADNRPPPRTTFQPPPPPDATPTVITSVLPTNINTPSNSESVVINLRNQESDTLPTAPPTSNVISQPTPTLLNPLPVPEIINTIDNLPPTIQPTLPTTTSPPTNIVNQPAVQPISPTTITPPTTITTSTTPLFTPTTTSNDSSNILPSIATPTTPVAPNRPSTISTPILTTPTTTRPASSPPAMRQKRPYNKKPLPTPRPLSNRIAERKDAEANKLSLKQALAIDEPTRKKKINEALDKELEACMRIFQPTNVRDMSAKNLSSAIQLFTFHKEKTKADGSYDKDKFRVVPASQHRDPSSIGETKSPTVNPISAFIQLQITATQPKSILSAIDMKEAFLKTTNKGGIYVVAQGQLAQVFIQKFPSLKRVLHKDRIYFELKSWMYGLHEAPREFNILINSIILSYGFKR